LEAEEAARADCGGTRDRTRCARSEGGANLFTLPHADEREGASSGRLASTAGCLAYCRNSRAATDLSNEIVGNFGVPGNSFNGAVPYPPYFPSSMMLRFFLSDVH
jgi:hypothetical protein